MFAALQSEMIYALADSQSGDAAITRNGYHIQATYSVVGGRALLQGKHLTTGQPVLIERITGISRAKMQAALKQHQPLLRCENRQLARSLTGFSAHDALYLPMVVGTGMPLSIADRYYSQAQVLALGIQMCTVHNYLTYQQIETEHLIFDPFSFYLTTSDCLKLTQISGLVGIRAPRYRSSLLARHRVGVRRHIAGIGATLCRLLTGLADGDKADVATVARLRPDISDSFLTAVQRMLTGTKPHSWSDTVTLRHALLQLQHT